MISLRAQAPGRLGSTSRPSFAAWAFIQSSLTFVHTDALVFWIPLKAHRQLVCRQAEGRRRHAGRHVRTARGWPELSAAGSAKRRLEEDSGKSRHRRVQEEPS